MELKTHKQSSDTNVATTVAVSTPTSDAALTDCNSPTNSVLSTRENMITLIDEMETLSKELLLQTINSNKPSKVSADATKNEMLELTKLLVRKQSELMQHVGIAAEQQLVDYKIGRVKQALVESDSSIKSLLIYLKEAEQVLSSAVYQSRAKLNMIKKSKPLPSELIVRYAHKISSEFGVCCPENWTNDNPRRPYPTDADMRKGWLGKLNIINNDLNVVMQTEEAKDDDDMGQNLMRSNSKVIDPIVPHEFGFSRDKFSVHSTEYMSDLSSDNNSDSDSNMT